MLRLIATSSVLVLALSGTVVAQTAPAAPAGPSSAARAAFAERAATFALRGAYRTIADAEARGASTYLDAAKRHYRDALARLQRHDAGAASEAMAAGALARAAVAEHPAPVPRDIPAPPALIAGGAPDAMMHRAPVAMGAGGGPATGGAQQRGPSMQRGRMQAGRMQYRRGGMGEHFDAARLAADVKLANTAETRDLAQKAIDADVARTKAEFGGNRDEAMRQGRLANNLAMAVRSLALADHPRTFIRRPMTPGGARPGSRPA
jgi:hypothetical protein